MWVELPNFWIITLNVIGIPLAHVALSIAATKLPIRYFRSKNAHRSRPVELLLHSKVFHTRRWKQLLPDAAPWIGGFPKGKLLNTEPDYLDTFTSETRRGELAHWAQIIVIASYIIWNPWPANLVILFYAALSNLPCILNLRFTRIRLQRVLHQQANHNV